MKREPEERLLDACLGEVLGGETPPDLTARILEAWEERRSPAADRSASESNESTAIPFAQPVPPPVAATKQTGAGKYAQPQPETQETQTPSVSLQAHARHLRHRARHQHRRFFSSLAVTLLVATAGVSIGVVALVLSQSGPFGPTVAEQERTPSETDENTRPTDGPLVAGHSNENESPVAEKPVQGNSLAKRNQEASEGSTRPPELAGPELVGPGSSAIAQDSASPSPEKDSASSVPPWYVRADAEPLEDSEVVARIDDIIRRQWSENDVEPAEHATDAEWCRRTYLALLGRIPTVDELTSFMASEDPAKRVQLVDSLQSDPGYSDEYASNWGTYWTNVLIGRTGGTRQNDLADREGLLIYLRKAMQEDRSFNRMAYELLTASGSNRPGTPDFNGATNFLLSQIDEKGVLATARTSQVFHGKQIQCVQCHNHPSSRNGWTQNQFWELNAFFRQLDVREDREHKAVKLVDRDFLGEGGGNGEEAEIYYEELNGYTRAVYPRFPGAQPISPSGLVEEVNRRSELGRFVATTEDLSRATVNRLWGQMFGYGFTRPIDDMGPHNPPSHPELLDLLAEQFAANDFSTKKLVRWMALSEPFNLSSKVGSENAADAPEIGSVALFSRYYTRQMEPEAVYDSLVVLAQAHNGRRREPGTIDNSIAARTSWLGQFMRNMETDEGQEDTTFDGGIQQSLIMMNGPLMEKATRIEPGSLLHQLINSELSMAEKVDHLFLASVSRHPTGKERKLIQKLLETTPRDQEAQTLQSIWWALLNSNEFILDH